MPLPPEDKIRAIKDQHPNRALYVIDVAEGKNPDGTDGEVSLTVVMTAPERGEYRMFSEQLSKAAENKNAIDKVWAMRSVIESHALQQIRWPSREECMEAFRLRPAMIDGFADELQKAAGEQVEFRRKKL